MDLISNLIKQDDRLLQNYQRLVDANAINIEKVRYYFNKLTNVIEVNTVNLILIRLKMI